MRIRTVVVFIGVSLLAAACGEDRSPDKVSQPQVSPEIKSCMDAGLNLVVRNETDRAKRARAVKEAFEATAKSCKLDAQSRESYLQYTNAAEGVLPDSTEDTSVRSRRRVIEKSTGRIGSTTEVFSNGRASIRWESGGDVTLDADALAIQVERRGGVEANIDVLDKATRKEGRSKSVFADGSAEVKWGSAPMVIARVSDLAPGVVCLREYCEQSRVMELATERRGTILVVYANGVSRVKWDNGQVSVTDIEKLAFQQ